MRLLLSDGRLRLRRPTAKMTGSWEEGNGGKVGAGTGARKGRGGLEYQVRLYVVAIVWRADIEHWIPRHDRHQA